MSSSSTEDRHGHFGEQWGSHLRHGRGGDFFLVDTPLEELLEVVVAGEGGAGLVLLEQERDVRLDVAPLHVGNLEGAVCVGHELTSWFAASVYFSIVRGERFAARR